MAQVINTNVMSLNAQRNLNASGSGLATSIQRLSSGLRINSAKDDAAGLAISERFTTQIRGLDVAIRNANDGISLAQTAEGAMVEIGNNLQRIRELAVQSANATNSKTDREALQAEVNQLIAEIDRVAKQTNFNGTKLLDGSFTGQLFQVGADAGQTISIDTITNAGKSALGATKFSTATLTLAATGTAAAGYAAIAAGTLTVNGKTVNVAAVPAGAAGGTDTSQALAAKLAHGAAIVAGVNAMSSETNVIAEMDAAGLVTLSQFSGTTAMTVTAGTGMTAGTVAEATKYVSDLDVTSFGASTKALAIADKGLEAISTARAQMGAIQNRFTSTVANLSTTSENLSASRSRIRDTDYAKETAELTRTQILQQAGTAMLAQANSAPQSILSLLE